MTERSDAQFGAGDQDALRVLNEHELVALKNRIFDTFRGRIVEAAAETASMAGKGFDAFFVRTNQSPIGGIVCSRLRLIPPLEGTNSTRAGYHPLYQDVKQLVIEEPTRIESRGNGPSVLLFTLTAYDGAKAHFIMSKECLLEIDPRGDNVEFVISGDRTLLVYVGAGSNGENVALDLDSSEILSEDELTRRIGILGLFNDILGSYKIGNQSRHDGTAK